MFLWWHFFLSTGLLRNRKGFSCVHKTKSYGKTNGSWGGQEKKCANTRLRCVFRFLLNFHECYQRLVKTTKTVFYSFFILPHSVALESYVKAFQYKELKSILYTNTKLCKIGFKTDDLCSFCEAQPETLYHLLFHCVFARHFWNEFQIYWHQLSNQHIQLTLQDVLLGIISYPCPLLNLLNYFIIIGKLFLWDCRRCKIRPNIQGFYTKIAIKYETERKIKKDFFQEKMGLKP